MGFNTTVVVLNNALDQIATDPQFGKKLADAISRVGCYTKREDVSAGNHCNAATVIETHHADQFAIVAVGQNYGVNLGTHYLYGEQPIEELALKQMAEKMGYRLVKKSIKK